MTDVVLRSYYIINNKLTHVECTLLSTCDILWQTIVFNHVEIININDYIIY